MSEMDYGALGLAVRDEVAEYFGRLSCINAVAALVDTAEVLGGRVSALTVRAFIYNPRITQALGDVNDPGAAERLQQAVAAGGQDTVALGMETSSGLPAGDWAGHLVGVVENFKPGKSLVIDATIEQANQPAQGILLRPVFLVVQPELLRSLFRAQIERCEVQYKAFPEETYFRSTGAWRNQEQRQIVRDRVLRRLGRI
jgi:hypothetical protein